MQSMSLVAPSDEEVSMIVSAARRCEDAAFIAYSSSVKSPSGWLVSGSRVFPSWLSVAWSDVVPCWPTCNILANHNWVTLTALKYATEFNTSDKKTVYADHNWNHHSVYVYHYKLNSLKQCGANNSRKQLVKQESKTRDIQLQQTTELSLTWSYRFLKTMMLQTTISRVNKFLDKTKKYTLILFCFLILRQQSRNFNIIFA